MCLFNHNTMKKISISIIIIFLLGFVSYLVLQKKQVTVPLSLETFSEIPSEIDGFSCYIFNSKEDMSNTKYLGVGDIGVEFFVSINGQFKKFSKINNILTNGEYQLNIIQSKNSTSTGSESYDIFGTITMTRVTNNTKLSKDFVGNCSW